MPQRVTRQANRHWSLAPHYQLGQCVWLSTRDLPLWVDSWKLAQCFVGPFLIIKVIIPSAVHLRLPSTLSVAVVKLVLSCPLVPTNPTPTAPISYQGLSCVHFPLPSHHQGHGVQYLVDWEVLRRGAGFQATTSWTLSSFRTSSSGNMLL